MSHNPLLTQLSLSIINDSDSISAELVPQSMPGLEVYRRNFLFSHLEVLKENFSSIVKILGEENFQYFSKAYIQEAPSRTYSIEEYGENFPSFLEQKEKLEDMPYLKDIAKLDYCFSQFPLSVGAEVIVSSGIFSLWKAISLDNPVNNIEIDASFIEHWILRVDSENIPYYKKGQ